MMTNFEEFNLPKALTSALERLEIYTPTPIQQKSFKPILSGRDVMGIAQTGTGKTLAYLLPLLREYTYSKTNNPKIIILVPTRELVVQVTEIVESLTQDIAVRILGIYGGVNINTQKKQVFEGVDILIGTPGRVMDLAIDKVLSFSEVKKLVVDEFDEMLSLGFKGQLSTIFTMMHTKRQNILFSATMTDQVDAMLEEYFANPVEITLEKSGTPLEKIQQYRYQVFNFNTKINLLIHLLQTDEEIDKVLIFANNKKHADLIHTALEEIFPDTFGVIHSNKSQNFRLRTMKEFSDNELRGIITTDIMARGLDIPDVTHVINMEIPEVPEQYIHRIGRTGRADKEGIAISFNTEKEEEAFQRIEILMDKIVETIDFPEEEVAINTKKIDAEKDRIIIASPHKKKTIEKGSAFQEKKKKNTKINLGGPTKRKPPKSKPKNRGQQKQKAKNKRKNNL